MTDRIYTPRRSNPNRRPVTKIRRKLIFVGVTILLFIVIITLSMVSTFVTGKKLSDRVSLGRNSLAAARTADAPRYATITYANAQRQWQSLLLQWKLENAKFFVSRNYNSIQNIADSVISTANDAAREASTLHDSLQIMCKKKIETLKKSRQEIRENYRNVPVNLILRKNFSNGEMLLSQGESAFNRGDYLLASEKLTRAELHISRLGEVAANKIEEYLNQVPMWKNWAASTVDWSRKNGGVAVIVDKMAQVCRIYSKGVCITSFDAEFGPNWMCHKLMSGDKATPEGKYQIRRKKSGGQTIYYKALEINYPNAEDYKTFTQKKKEGLVATGANPGGLIEIHGGGIRGANWTDGCVALCNSDMDKLFRLVNVGTPVTIVGALEGDR